MRTAQLGAVRYGRLAASHGQVAFPVDKENANIKEHGRKGNYL